MITIVPNIDAVLQEKSALIDSQMREIDHLRSAIRVIIKNINSGDVKGALIEAMIASSSYMSANGWVKQLSDGTVVKSDA